MIDMDTVASEGSWEAALHAAGGAVARGGPPAATREAASPSAAPARRATTPSAGTRDGLLPLQQRRGCRRPTPRPSTGSSASLILDWDVHHGNGTEAIFYESAEVLYASIHQSPLYPGTGAACDVGRGAGEGFTRQPAGAAGQRLGASSWR